ncbi:DUF6113 family protein [Streptomyces sp. NPDC050504]|uniref:DUF6113 family protein n=1 Tax=Streptomyces sp. NPDC050504 TaxID=3365618 RepID=UPI00379A4672
MSGSSQQPGAWLASPFKPGRIAVYLVLALLGAVVGAAGALIQAAWFPGGLLLALFGTAGLFYAGRVLTGTGMGAGAPAAGWLGAIVLLLNGRPEGDYVFGELLGLTLFLLGGAAAAVMCATMSRLPQPDTEPGRLGK